MITIGINELIKWKGPKFASIIQREKDNIKNISDLLSFYGINKIVGRGGLKMYRIIKR